MVFASSRPRTADRSVRPRGRALAALLTALALLATACGGDGDDGGDTEPATDQADDGEATGEAGDTGDAGGEEEGEATGEPIQVAVLTSTSGPLSSYGDQYVEGFELGLEYATDGTNAVDGRPIEVTFEDDTGDPERATSIATDLIGQGYQIIAGTVVSGVALQLAPIAEQNDILYISGPAAADAITGANRNTFRSGRQTWQDITTSAQFIDQIEGQDVTVFAQDTAFGQANVAAVEAVLGEQGATVDSILVPAETSDFTPFAARASEASPDLLFVAWAGETASAMWQSLDQQGVLDETTVATGLDQRASYETFGEVAERIDFLAHYVAEAPDNEVNDWLIENHSGTPDLFTPDGFVAAQMIVHAIQESGGDDVQAMIEALEGWSFDGPKGGYTVRAEDHAMLQPMFQVRLTQQDGEFVPELVETYDADTVAPPEGSFDGEG